MWNAIAHGASILLSAWLHAYSSRAHFEKLCVTVRTGLSRSTN